jgi:hypothetical protein
LSKNCKSLIFLVQASLDKKGGLKPALPNATRWGSTDKCLATFMKNFPLYSEIANEHGDEMSDHVKKALLEGGLFAKALKIKSRTEAIYEGVQKVSYDNFFFI